MKVAMGFEDGRVELWALAGGVGWKGPSDGRAGMTPWQRRYEGKKHNEAGEQFSLSLSHRAEEEVALLTCQ